MSKKVAVSALMHRRDIKRLSRKLEDNKEDGTPSLILKGAADFSPGSQQVRWPPGMCQEL